jgi:hypothetical protein
MREDAHLHSHEPATQRPLSADIPWMIACAALMAFVFYAMAGEVR